MTKGLVLLLWASAACTLTAQSRHALKLDLTAPAQQSARIAYEYRLHKQSSLELSIGYHKHNNRPDWLFHGDLIAHYLLQQQDIYNYATGVKTTEGWKVTESQPLPQAPEFFPLFSMQTRLGWRFWFFKEINKWRFYLQPGIGTSYFRFYEIEDENREEFQYKNVWTTGTYPYETRIEQYSIGIQQTRSMRQVDTWIPGVTYDLGFVYKFGRHFFMEGRLSAGGNLVNPYNSPRPPIPVRPLWAQGSVLAGWAF